VVANGLGNYSRKNRVQKMVEAGEDQGEVRCLERRDSDNSGGVLLALGNRSCVGLHWRCRALEHRLQQRTVPTRWRLGN
jgi:hypothetical protein